MESLTRYSAREAGFSAVVLWEVYCPEATWKVIQEVGKRLSKARHYLQHPINLKSDVPYKNPHFYATPGVRNESGLYVSPSCGEKEQQDSVLDIAKIFEEVDHSRKLPSRNADWHIKTPLLEYDSSPKHMIGH